MVAPLNLRLEAYAKLSKDDHIVLDRMALSPMREVAARRELIREGDTPRSASLILEGWACRYKALPDGRRQIVDFLVPGDLCHFNPHLQRPMDHAIAAITALKVAEIPYEDIEQVTNRHPGITKALWWDEMVNMSIQREWTLNVGQRTAYERIAHLLCELFLRLEMVGRTAGKSCEFPLTQLDIADATGLTAVHVNRTLQELRRDALIELQSRTLTIPDLGALKNAGLFNPNYLHLAQAGSGVNAEA